MPVAVVVADDLPFQIIIIVPRYLATCLNPLYFLQPLHCPLNKFCLQLLRR